MICRHYTEGQKLNVADLNEITVLIDRSETELTEVGLNTWRKGLEGPPHSHEAKEQIFYVTAGEGVVVVGDARHAVKPGSLVHVPVGVLHQTAVTGSQALSYLLFNAFLDAGKEGHASFADHIEKVKATRKQQAAAGRTGSGGARPPSASAEAGKHIPNVREGRVFDFGSNTSTLLLERNETSRSEVTLVTWPKGNKGAMVAHKEKEQTFFVLEGQGQVTVAEETKRVGPGDVVFVPRQAPHTTAATESELTYLCFNTLVVEPPDKSFAESYQRVAPGRIARWKSGTRSVGE